MMGPTVRVRYRYSYSYRPGQAGAVVIHRGFSSHCSSLQTWTWTTWTTGRRVSLSRALDVAQVSQGLARRQAYYKLITVPTTSLPTYRTVQYSTVLQAVQASGSRGLGIRLTGDLRITRTSTVLTRGGSNPAPAACWAGYCVQYSTVLYSIDTVDSAIR